MFYPFNGGEIFNGLFVLDSFGGFFIFFFLGLAIVILIGSMKLLDKSHEMIALILISVIGMAALSISNDIIIIVHSVYTFFYFSYFDKLFM
ncbi:MAG: hypothetical protein ACTSU7_04190 [Candidatus Heimdallarchaeaceae archaeon]